MKAQDTPDDSKPRGRPFQPGQSGNPGGRPRVPPEVKEALRAATPAAARKLKKLVRSRDENVALKASIAVLDRVCGRPTQPIRGKHTHRFSDMTDEQLERRFAELVASRTSPTEEPQP